MIFTDESMNNFLDAGNARESFAGAASDEPQPRTVDMAPANDGTGIVVSNACRPGGA